MTVLPCPLPDNVEGIRDPHYYSYLMNTNSPNEAGEVVTSWVIKNSL